MNASLALKYVRYLFKTAAKILIEKRATQQALRPKNNLSVLQPIQLRRGSAIKWKLTGRAE
jgi:hypothetical protein